MPQPTFAHGARAGVLLDDRDLTRFSHTWNYAADVAQDESTCLQAPGGAKEYLYGNNGSSIGLDGRLAKSLTHVQRDMAAVMGQEDDPKLLTLAPFGFDLGTVVLTAKTRKQSYRVTGGTTSVVNTSASFQTDNQTRRGNMLLSPRGSGTLSLNEKVTLTATSATVSGVFTVKDALSNTLGTITVALGDTASQVATKIAALTYNGTALVATVTGSTTAAVAGTPAGITVSGAGNAATNGFYADTGTTLNGGTLYQKDSTHYLGYSSGTGRYAIADTTAHVTSGGTDSLYTSQAVAVGTVPTTGWQAQTGSLPAPAVSLTAATPGTPGNGSYAVEITAPAATPLAFSTTTTGWAAQEVQIGGTYNGVSVISVATNGTPVKTASAATVTTENRSAATLQATYVSPGTVSIPVVIEHAPDASGSPGAWTQLLAFVTITSGTNRVQTAQQIILPAGTTVQPWLRARVPSITGSAAIAVSLAR